MDTEMEIVNRAPDERPGEQANYFGFESRIKFFLPDGVSWIEFAKMNEGEKKMFQDKTSRDVVLERNSGNARMNMLQGTERHELIKSSIKDWNLRNEDGPVPCTPSNIQMFLTVADPQIIEDLEKAIRKANPWLLSEMSVEDIDKEIANLQEMRAIAEKRERGEGS
jgi:hypothetical protein